MIPNNIFYNPVSPQQFAQKKFNAQQALDYSKSLTNADPNMFGYTPQFNVGNQGGGGFNLPSAENMQIGAELLNMGTSMLPVNENPYKFDGNAPLRGIGQGAQAGSKFGAVGAIVGGALGGAIGGIKEVFDNRRELKNVNTDVNATSMSATGQPVYLGGNINRAMSDLNEINASGKKGQIFNRKLRREAQNKMSGAIENAQMDFNETSQGFNQDQIAREQYRQRRDLTNRMYNLYS